MLIDNIEHCILFSHKKIWVIPRKHFNKTQFDSDSYAFGRGISKMTESIRPNRDCWYDQILMTEWKKWWDMKEVSYIERVRLKPITFHLNYFYFLKFPLKNFNVTNMATFITLRHPVTILVTDTDFNLFPFSLIPRQPSLSLINVVTYPHCFLTAYKRLWRLPVLAGTSDSKNQDSYYCMCIFTLYLFRSTAIESYPEYRVEGTLNLESNDLD